MRYRAPLTFDFGGVWEPLPPLSRLSFTGVTGTGSALLGPLLGPLLVALLVALLGSAVPGTWCCGVALVHDSVPSRADGFTDSGF